MSNKKCFLFLADKNFLQGVKTLVKSLKKNSPKTEQYDKILLTDDYNIRYVDFVDKIFYIDTKKYEKFKGLKIKTLSKIEIFNFIRKTDYERIVYIDSDILCLGCLEFLFLDEHDDKDLLLCEDFGKNTRKAYSRVRERANFEPLQTFRENFYCINSGMMVINNKLKNFYENCIEALEKRITYDKGDQGVINEVLYTNKDIKIKIISSKFNCLKRIIHHKQNQKLFHQIKDDIRLFHFVGCKPWKDCPDYDIYNYYIDMWRKINVE